MLNDEEAVRQLDGLIKGCSALLDAEALKAVWHYRNHDEYEMAFEGLAIELIRNRAYPEGFAFNEWKVLAETFGLDKESVFDGEFWPKFVDWGSAHED